MKILQVLVFILSIVSLAHSQNATISGSVYFEKNKIEGVIINAVESNGKVFEAKTDFEGKYKILLPKGLFTVTLNHCAYEFEERKININSKRNLVIDFQPKIYIPHGCNFDEREVEVGFTPISKELLIDEKCILKGTVYDDYGAVIANSIVLIRGAKNFEKIVFTNEDGIFETNLSAGNYSIEVSSTGFQNFKLEKYRIAPVYKGKLNLDIVLEVRPCDDCHWIEATPVKTDKKPD